MRARAFQIPLIGGRMENFAGGGGDFFIEGKEQELF